MIALVVAIICSQGTGDLCLSLEHVPATLLGVELGKTTYKQAESIFGKAKHLTGIHPDSARESTKGGVTVMYDGLKVAPKNRGYIIDELTVEHWKGTLPNLASGKSLKYISRLKYADSLASCKDMLEAHHVSFTEVSYVEVSKVKGKHLLLCFDGKSRLNAIKFFQ